MKKQIVKCTSLALLILSAYACTTKEKAVVYPNGSMAKVDLSNANTSGAGLKEKTSQTFTGNGTSVIRITGTEGTDLQIHPYTLVDASGTPYTGDVRIELIEIYKKSDMVLSAAPTQSDGKTLISGGEFSIKAFDASGNPLFVAPGRGFIVDVPAPAPDNQMQLFTSSSQGANWQPVDPNAAVLVSITDTIRNKTSAPTIQVNQVNYRCILKEFTWYNCDYFLRNDIETINVGFEAKAAKELFGAQTYVVYRNKNSVIGVYGDSFKVMKDEPLSIVCVGYDAQDQLYYSITDIPAASTDITNLSVVLSAASRDEFTTALRGRVD